MKTHVVYFLTSPVRGGVEEHVLSLIKRLDRRHFRVSLVAPPALLDAFAADLRRIDVQTLAVTVDTPWRLRDIMDLVRLYRFLRRQRPDIVNCHLLRATFIGAPLAKLAGVRRVIATNHGPDPWRRGLIKGWYGIDRLVGRFIDLTIAVCASAKESLVRTKGLPADGIVVINNGRELEDFEPLPAAETAEVRRELQLPGTDTIVVIVGRLEEQKGHRFALDAMPTVLARHPHTRLLLVGDGGLRASLEKQAHALGVAERVIFTGFRRDVRRLLGVADVVALPSLWEGLPLTLIEALAMAKPVVATAVNGVPDVVIDGHTGLLVPAGDSDAFGRRLVELLDAPERAACLGRAGREHVLANFAIDRQINETARCYIAQPVLG
jgi:glycosyltransferase involved in cell wall biosynthesis